MNVAQGFHQAINAIGNVLLISESIFDTARIRVEIHYSRSSDLIQQFEIRTDFKDGFHATRSPNRVACLPCVQQAANSHLCNAQHKIRPDRRKQPKCCNQPSDGKGARFGSIFLAPVTTDSLLA